MAVRSHHVLLWPVREADHAGVLSAGRRCRLIAVYQAHLIVVEPQSACSCCAGSLHVNQAHGLGVQATKVLLKSGLLDSPKACLDGSEHPAHAPVSSDTCRGRSFLATGNITLTPSLCSYLVPQTALLDFRLHAECSVAIHTCRCQPYH